MRRNSIYFFCLANCVLNSELKIEGQKQRHPSGGVSVSSEMVLGLEGVELGADGKVRSASLHGPWFNFSSVLFLGSGGCDHFWHKLGDNLAI